MSKLAIHGGKPVIKNKLKPYNSIEKSDFKYLRGIMNTGLLSGFVASKSDEFHGGPYVRKLEEISKNIFKVKNAISLNSNTSGLIAAIGAINTSPGDEIIVPPYTMSATAMAPLHYGAIPVFADIERDYFCLDINDVKKKITSKTKAIIAVNLFGHPAELKKLKKLCKKNNIYLIEDNAQAPLAEEFGEITGTVGDIGVFSLNRHKHVHTGEGGICVTNNDELAYKLKLIRNHGECVYDGKSKKILINNIGYNFRLDEISASIAVSQLNKINKIVNNRIDKTTQLIEGIRHLEGIITPKVRKGCKHVYYVMPMRINEKLLGVNRDSFAKALASEGLPINQGYVKPLYELPIFKKKIGFGRTNFPFNMTKINYNKISCPVVEKMHYREELGFGICSFKLDKQELKQIIKIFNKVHENRQKI